jgi:hypothetical protein
VEGLQGTLSAIITSRDSFLGRNKKGFIMMFKKRLPKITWSLCFELAEVEMMIF